MRSDKPSAKQAQQDSPLPAQSNPPAAKEERDDDWVADVKRWYFERSRGVDVAKRQEVLKDLQ